MNVNPDVNRLSLEKRIELLENRLPAGGGVVGGIPYCHPDIIESCRLNEFTKVDGGWLIKFDIPDTGAVPGSSVRNIALKACFFFPVINGIVCSPSQVCVQLKYKVAGAVQTGVFSFDHVFTDQSFFDASGIRQQAPRPALWVTQQLQTCYEYSRGSYGTVPQNFQLAFFNPTTLRLYMSIHGLSSVLQCSSQAVIFTQPVSLGSLPVVSTPGSAIYLGGTPHSATGYTRDANDPIPQHPLVPFLPQSWR